METLGKFALDKTLSFNWYDAAVLCQKIRELHTKKILEDF